MSASTTMVGSDAVSDRDPSMSLNLPEQPEAMRLWRKVIALWDSLEEQVLYAMNPPDDWTDEEWGALSEDNRKTLIQQRRLAAEKPLAQLLELHRELTKSGGKHFKTLAETELYESLLGFHREVVLWIRGGSKPEDSPWLGEDLSKLVENARAEPHVKSGVEKIAAHVVAQLFPSSTTYDVLWNKVKEAKGLKT